MINFIVELSYKTSRSSGAGGQNVNKVETAVTTLWNVSESSFFSDSQKNMIFIKLKNRINSDGILQLTATENRTQLQNKKSATERMLAIVNQAIFIAKIRKATKPSKGKIQKRLDNKKKNSEKKESRKFRF